MAVLVALDGSSISEEVLKAIAPYLNRTGTRAELVTVIAPRETRGLGGQAVESWAPRDTLSGGTLHVGARRVRAPEDHTQALDRARTEHAEYLRHLAGEHLKGTDYEIHVEISDDPAGAIGQLAERLRVDAIAVGTHGRGGLKRALLGSTAEEIIRRAPVPVFVVREGMRAPSEITP